MMRGEKGFTMVELLITMVVFVFVMLAASQIFSGLLTQFKQQSKIAETNIEGVIGLEILRQDLAHAGYGLPWNVERVIIPDNDPDADNNLWEHLSPYREASSGPSPNPASFNDSTRDLDGDGSDGEAPRAIFSGNSVTFSGPNSVFTNSDYLVIKSNKVALNEASQKWTILKTLTMPDNLRQWTPESENLESTDRIVVIAPGSRDSDARRLKVDASNSNDYRTTFGIVNTSTWTPPDNTETNLVYGINITTDPLPVRPFNRADYFISGVDADGSTNIRPSRCAPNTGVLVKAVMNHDDNGSFNYFPLFDCVADMEIFFGVDTDSAPDGNLNCYVDNLSDVFATVDAENIRNRVKEIRVYLLAHEGQIDRSFSFIAPINSNSIRVGELSTNIPGGSCTGATVLGQDFNFSGINDWQNYRWKVYTLVVKPIDLR